MNDAQIVSEVLAGNRDQFNLLVDRYLVMVRGMCASHVYDPGERDDLVQESFVHSYQKLNTLRRRELFGPWLAKITRSKCLNWIRSRGRREKAYGALAKEPETSTESPLDKLSRQELYAWVKNQLSSLCLASVEKGVFH
ncbi:RNA polymerase sigma factor, partial [Candidatus Hydrogenedentota bacterium]